MSWEYQEITALKKEADYFRTSINTLNKRLEEWSKMLAELDSEVKMLRETVSRLGDIVYGVDD